MAAADHWDSGWPDVHALTMGKDRSLAVLRAGGGGLLAGLALGAPGWCPSGPWLMLPALALLWSTVRLPAAAACWGGVGVLVSHRWLLGLHPLTWIGVPEPLSLPAAVGIWIICAASGSALVFVWARLASSSHRIGFSAALGLSCLWGLAEVCLATGPLFWIGVGGSLLPTDPLAAGLARWIGSGGLASVQIFAGWLLWRAITATPAQRRSWVVSTLGVLLLVHGGGWVALNGGMGFTGANASSPAVRVALWQPAIPTREKFNRSQQIRLRQQLETVLRDADQLGAAIVVAPEGTFPLRHALEAPAPVSLLTGGFRWQRGEQRSSLLLVEQGSQRPSAAVDKHRLVPLGEWIPPWLAGAGGLSAVGGVMPGEPSRFWPGPIAPAGVAICYELSDGSALAHAVGDGAEWLLTIANLDPYPLLLQQQFLALAQLRSIETSRPLLSAANTGPTLALSSDGKVLDRLPSGSSGVLLTDLSPRQTLTPYVRWGERPLWLLLLLSSLWWFRSQVPGSGRRPGPDLRRRTPPPDRG